MPIILITISMRSLQEWWRTKIDSLPPITPEQLKIAAVAGFMCGAFLVFKYLRPKPSSAQHLIQQTLEAINNAIPKAQLSRQPLVVEQIHECQGQEVPMRWLLVSKLREKEKSRIQSIKNPFIPPFEQGLFIKDLGANHRLLFNKYNIHQEHLLVVTKEFEPQSSKLTREDFKQTIVTFRAVRGLFFFNSGPKAGASQLHKHIQVKNLLNTGKSHLSQGRYMMMQVFPSEARKMPIFRAVLQFAKELKYKHQDRSLQGSSASEVQIFTYPHFRFKHGLVLIGAQSSFDSTFESDHERARYIIFNTGIFDRIQVFSIEYRQLRDDTGKLRQSAYLAYVKLYRQLIEKSEEGELREYNLIGCEHYLLLIPRRREKAFEQVSVNAVGFMGEVLFKDKRLMTKYIQSGRQGRQLLEDITFSKKHK